MLNKTTTNLIKQLKKTNLPLEDRTALITVLLDKLTILKVNVSFGVLLMVIFCDVVLILHDEVTFRLIV